MAGGEAGLVDVENAGQVGGSATGMDDGRRAVEVDDHARGLGHQCGRQRSGQGHSVEQRRLIEALHLDDGVGERSAAVQCHPCRRLPA